MASNRKILSARRSYEFSMDGIRLSVLSLPHVEEVIKQAFGFRVSTIGTPQATFGVVPNTLPPGLVFNLGAWPGATHIVPIRFMHFEQRRIVIDVVDASSAIDGVYQHLRELLGSLEAPDGGPAIGKHNNFFDYTEISAEYLFGLENLLSEAMVASTADMLTAAGLAGDKVIVPTVSLQFQAPSEEYQGLSADNTLIQIGVRAGTRPRERVYFSAAPFDSDTHIAYLHRLEKASGDGRQRKQAKGSSRTK
jgi:hypothetical protein